MCIVCTYVTLNSLSVLVEVSKLPFGLIKAVKVLATYLSNRLGLHIRSSSLNQQFTINFIPKIGVFDIL